MNNDSCDREWGLAPATSSRMQAYASRTVDFLNVIEKAVSRLAADRAVVLALAKDAESVLSDLKENPPKEIIDDEGRICHLLEQAAASARRQYEGLIPLRNSAKADFDLRPEDGVVDGFNELIDGFATFHNVIEDLRDTIETMDAMKSPVLEGSFTSVEDLLAAIQAH